MPLLTVGLNVWTELCKFKQTISNRTLCSKEQAAACVNFPNKAMKCADLLGSKLPSLVLMVLQNKWVHDGSDAVRTMTWTLRHVRWMMSSINRGAFSVSHMPTPNQTPHTCTPTETKISSYQSNTQLHIQTSPMTTMLRTTRLPPGRRALLPHPTPPTSTATTTTPARPITFATGKSYRPILLTGTRGGAPKPNPSKSSLFFTRPPSTWSESTQVYPSANPPL